MGIRPRLLLKNKVFIRWEFLSPFCKKKSGSRQSGIEAGRGFLEGPGEEQRGRDWRRASHAEAGLSLSLLQVTRDACILNLLKHS